MNTGQDKNKFKELLDTEYSWPAQYTFKFVVSSNQIESVKSLFSADAEFGLKESSAGKYTSVTINARMLNADEIIDIYEKAAAIEGIISL